MSGYARRSADRDLAGMLALPLPVLSDAQFSLPEPVDEMYICTILPGDATQLFADAWCRFAESNLLRAGRSVRPLRVAAETARAAVRAAAANESAGDGQSTTSFVPSTDSDAGSGTTLTDVSEL